jgi:hypothetical protein
MATTNTPTEPEESSTERIVETPVGPTVARGEPVEMLVETPMETNTRLDCKARVAGWAEEQYQAVLIEIDIGAKEPLKLSLPASDAETFATAILAGAENPAER